MPPSSLFPPMRRLSSPFLEALMAPVDLTDGELIQALLSIARELVVSSSGKMKTAFQWKNLRSLTRKVEVLVVVLEECEAVYSYTALLCFKELYLLLNRSKILLDYCFQSSKLWLLLQNESISVQFNDLNQEISSLLDVLPIDELKLSLDVREQIDLLKRQLRKAKLYVDKSDEVVRRRFYSFLNEFENGHVPDCGQLLSFFVDGLGIKDARSCRAEIDFLEEQILCNHQGDLDPSVVLLNGFVALSRYCSFLLFGFDEDDETEAVSKGQGIDQTSLAAAAPKDFFCPISLDLMTDPVIVSTGQTYDRSSITRWMDEGHCTCPKTAQLLAHKGLLPNQALRSLVVQWCTANRVPFDAAADSSSQTLPAACVVSKAALEANRATAALLIRQLAEGSEDTKGIAAREIRRMAKTGKEFGSYIAEAGAIPHLCKLLLSPNGVTQENSVTAILNLSIDIQNKSRIMEEERCLELIINVLWYGHTAEARENAATTLFSLSAVRDYRRRIADMEGAIEALVSLLREGKTRGKKDAVTALFNLSTHPENCLRLIEGGAVAALVGALEVEEVCEDAAGVLALIVKKSIGAEAVGKEKAGVGSLMRMMRSATPRGKENAVAVLLELCRSGGASVAERVLRAPTLSCLLQTLFLTGTKRARRKSASLARVVQRREQALLRSRGLRYALPGNSAADTDLGHSNEVRLPMPISVPVV